MIEIITTPAQRVALATFFEMRDAATAADNIQKEQRLSILADFPDASQTIRLLSSARDRALLGVIAPQMRKSIPLLVVQGHEPELFAAIIEAGLVQAAPMKSFDDQAPDLLKKLRRAGMIEESLYSRTVKPK